MLQFTESEDVDMLLTQPHEKVIFLKTPFIHNTTERLLLKGEWSPLIKRLTIKVTLNSLLLLANVVKPSKLNEKFQKK